VKETGLIQMSRKIFSLLWLIHQCKCVQKWSYQQLMNTNSNYYWDKYSCLQLGIQISQMFPGMWKYATSCLCTNNNEIINLKHWRSVSTNKQYPHNKSLALCKYHIHNLHVQKLPHLQAWYSW
jgi:hypothetical protein